MKVLDKVLSVFLAFAMTISLSPFSVIAQHSVAYAQDEQEPAVTAPVAGDDQAQTPAAPEEPADNAEQPDEDDDLAIQADDENGDLDALATTVSKSAKQEFKIQWNDSANEDGGRPALEDLNDPTKSPITFGITLTLVGGGTPLCTDETVSTNNVLSRLGIQWSAFTSAAYAFAKVNDGLIQAPASLPTEVTIPNDKGENVKYSVTYTMHVNESTLNKLVPQGKDITYFVQEYAAKELRIHEYSTYKADISWYDESNKNNWRPSASADEIKGTFEVYHYLSSEPVTAAKLTDIKVDLKVDTGDSDIWNVTLKDAPKYDVNGSGRPYVYYVKEVKDETTGAYVMKPVGDPNTDDVYYRFLRNVDRYTSETAGLFDGGVLRETLGGREIIKLHKEWKDDNTDPSQRPETYLLLMRLSQADAEDGKWDNAAPVQGFDTAAVPQEEGDIEIGWSEVLDPEGKGTGVFTEGLPRFDADGAKYVYFVQEKKLPFPYVCQIEYDSKAESPEVIAGAKEKGYGLNGSVLTNIRDSKEVSGPTKTFKAQSMQSMDPEGTEVIFKMQSRLKDHADSQWTFADPEISTTVKGFSAEQPTITGQKVTMPKYDATGAELEYRWVETGMKINGGEEKTVTPIATDNGVEYESVNAGVVGPGLGGGNNQTTAWFQPVTNSDTSVTNILQGNMNIKLVKTWSYYGVALAIDDEGNGILTNDVTLPDGTKKSKNDVIANLADTVVKIEITSDNGTTYEVGLKYDGTVVDANGVVDDSWASTGKWHANKDFPRYDENGRELIYRIDEKSVVNPHGFGKGDQVFSTGTEPRTSDNTVNAYLQDVMTNVLGPGPAIAIDVYKYWLDGSDLISRHPVQVSLFEVDAQGNVSSTPVILPGGATTVQLDNKNQWYKRISLPVVGGKSVDDYVAREVTVGENGQVVAVSNASTSAAAYRNATDAKVADLIESGSGKIDYNYDVLSRYENVSSTFGVYSVTNRRVGLMNVSLTKTWNTGSKPQPATFQLYRNGEKYGDPQTLKPAQETSPSSAGWDITNLDKYDSNGEMYVYTMKELTYGPEGQAVDISSGSCQFTVDGVTDNVVADMEQKPLSSEPVAKRSPDYSYIAPDAEHHTGDIYRFAGTNGFSGSYPLDLNLVWRDDGTALNDVARPDVAFDVYRVAVPAGWDGMSNDAKAEYLQTQKNKDNKFITDVEWNTEHNDYWWSCDLGYVPRYDNHGNEYVYFAVERFTGGQGVYQASYDDNYSDAFGSTKTGTNTPQTVGGTPTHTSQVLSLPTKDLKQGGVKDGSGAVVILSDGHTGKTETGKYDEDLKGIGEAYSRTIVNYRVDDRYISGEKVWNFESGWNLPSSAMPEITVELYEFDDPIVDKETGARIQSLTKEELKKIIDDAVAAKTARLVATDTVSGKSANGYHFRFQKSMIDNENLARYDSWGCTKNYYVYEKTDLVNYPDKNIVLSLSTFSIENTYETVIEDDPRVDITFTKEWINELGEIKDMVPHKFELYMQATQSTGEDSYALIGNARKVATTTLNPGTEAANTSYTFTKFDKDLAGENENLLPKVGPNGDPVVYWIVESTSVNGYKYTDPKTVIGGSKDNPLHTSDMAADATDKTLFHGTATNTKEGAPTFSNDYNGAPTNLTITKNWYSDTYVVDSHTVYRPDKIDVTIVRTWGKANNVNGNSVGEYVNMTTTDFGYATEDASKAVVTIASADLDLSASAPNRWKKIISSLPKYAPNGAEYNYKIGKPSNIENPTVPVEKMYAADGTDWPYADRYQLSTTGSKMTPEAINTFDTVIVVADKVFKYTAPDANGEIKTYSFDKTTWNRAFDAKALPLKIHYVVQRTSTGEPGWNTVPANGVAIPGRSLSINPTAAGLPAGDNIVGATHMLAKNKFEYKTVFALSDVATNG